MTTGRRRFLKRKKNRRGVLRQRSNEPDKLKIVNLRARPPRTRTTTVITLRSSHGRMELCVVYTRRAPFSTVNWLAGRKQRFFRSLHRISFIRP